MTAEPLQSLLSRVREAKGPDRRLNWEVWWYCAANGGKGNTHPPPKDYEREHWLSAPLYTGNVAEAIALVERVLPGWHWGLSRCIGEPDGRDSFSASVYDLSVERTMQPDFEEFAATPALALLAAILSALIASKTKEA